MLKRADGIGLSGLLMLVGGAALFLTGSQERLSWMYWVLGPFMWFIGFAIFVGWVMWRGCEASVQREKPSKAEAAGAGHGLHGKKPA